MIGGVTNFTSYRHYIACICRVAADCKRVEAMSLGLSAKIIENLGFSAERNVFFAIFGKKDGVGKICSFDNLDHEIKKGLQKSTTSRNN